MTNYDPPSSGTTTGIQPGLTHRTNVNALPVYNAWKASVVFGMDRAAAAGSLDRRYAQLLGRTCLDDVGWTWVRGLIPGHAVPFFNFDIATGDGILVFAGAPDTLDITPPPPDTVAGNYAYYHNGEWHIHKDIV